MHLPSVHVRFQKVTKKTVFPPKPTTKLKNRMTLLSLTAQKMKFSVKETADLVTFTEEILNGKLYFLCTDFFSYFGLHKWLTYVVSMFDGRILDPLFANILRKTPKFCIISWCENDVKKQSFPRVLGGFPQSFSTKHAHQEVRWILHSGR